MKNCILLVSAWLFCCLPFLTFAQADYRSGYLITTSGDSLSGFIRVQETTLSPTEINFRKTIDASENTVYKPAELRFTVIEGYGSFEAYTGTITMDKINFPDLPANRDMSNESGTYLFEVIQKGKNVTFYSYTDATKTRLFIKEQGGPMTELSYKHYFLEQDGKKLARKQEYYKTQLLATAENLQVSNSKLKSQIANAAYTSKDLINIISAFNGLSVEAAKEERTKQYDGTFFAGAGVNTSSLTFRGEHPLASNSQQDNPLQLRAAAGHNFYLRPRTKRFVLRTEAFVSRFVINATSEVPVGSLRGAYTYHLDQVLFGISPQLLYNVYRSAGLRFYAGAGGTAHFHHVLNTSMERSSPGTPDPIKMESASSSAKFSAGFPVRVGVIFSERVELTGMYTRTFATGSMAYNSLLENLHLGVNYHFGKRL